jgi:hypothetical protein
MAKHTISVSITKSACIVVPSKYYPPVRSLLSETLNVRDKSYASQFHTNTTDLDLKTFRRDLVTLGPEISTFMRASLNKLGRNFQGDLEFRTP